MRVIWWVRHGPTHRTALGGWRDVAADLSDRAALDRLSAGLPPGAPVVSSDLRRARETAEAIAGARRRLPDEPDLREFHHGAWEGLTWQEAAALHPDLTRAYWEDPGDAAPPGGESWNDGARRADACVARLLAARPETDIVAVSHHGVILTQLRRALGVAPRDVLAQRIEPLSVTCLGVEQGRWTAIRVNDPLT